MKAWLSMGVAASSSYTHMAELSIKYGGTKEGIVFGAVVTARRGGRCEWSGGAGVTTGGKVSLERCPEFVTSFP